MPQASRSAFCCVKLASHLLSGCLPLFEQLLSRNLVGPMGCLLIAVQKDRREMMEVNKEIVDKRTQLAVERITQWRSYVEVSAVCLPP